MLHTEPQKCADNAPGIALTLLVFAFLIISNPASAIMPPESYAQASRESNIKAIATIVDVENIHVGPRATTKNATFKLEYALTDSTLETFAGYCQSVDTAEQNSNIMSGGETYFYPHVGNKVFVTISTDGGPITSMTPMTSELDQIIREEPDRIKCGITRVRIKSQDGKSSKAVITTKEREMRLKRAGKYPAKPPVMGLEGLEAMFTRYDIHRSRDNIQGQLLVALGDDDIEKATLLIDQGADVNFGMDKTGMTPIMAAESVAMANLLIMRGAYPKATDFDDGTVLHYAVTRKNAPELIRYFISQGVDPNLRGWPNDPPVFVAAMFFREISAFDTDAKMKGDSPDPHATFTALIQNGADINAQQDSGQTLLMDAATGGDYNMARMLLKLGANTDIRDANGKTARDWAKEMGNKDISALLSD